MADMTLVNASLSVSGTGETFLPMGALYVAAALEDAGFSVDFRDYQLSEYREHLDPENFVDFLGTSSDIVGISAMSNMLPFLMLALARFKERYPAKRVVLGGCGPTGVARLLMERFPQVDVVVAGEAERTVVELMDRLSRGGGVSGLRDVPGLYFRDSGEVIATPGRERISELDEVRFPAYHLVDLSRYMNTSVMTTRGCPYACTFCDVAPLWHRKTTLRSVSNVVEEMRLLHDEHGLTTIHLLDDTFVLDRKRVLAFCAEVKRELPDVLWSCCGRVNLMDDGLMTEMSRAGCRGLFLGIESGSDKVLRDIKKRFTAGQAANAMKLASRHFDVKASFIYGFPTETLVDFHETVMLVAYASKLGLKYQVNLLAPLPLSEMHERHKNELFFTMERASSMVRTGYSGTVNGELKIYDDIIALVREHPDVFPGFYQVPSPDITEKDRILAEMGIMDWSFKVD